MAAFLVNLIFVAAVSWALAWFFVRRLFGMSNETGFRLGAWAAAASAVAVVAWRLSEALF